MNRDIDMQTICAPFVPDEEYPYIFVSYAHADRDLVFPIIKRIYENGWRVWYDEGLELGNDYYGSLKKHICECAVFLLFASPKAFNSHFITTCEIPQAREFNKKIVVLSLERDPKVDMPELCDAICTDSENIEYTLNEIAVLQRTESRKAVGHQISVNILKHIRDSEFDYNKCKKGIRITNIGSNDAVIHIPDVYPPFNGLDVVELDNHVFWRHTDLEKVYLPKKLKSIDFSTFLNNKHLKDIYIPKNVTVTNLLEAELSEAPYVVHCAEKSPAHMFAKENGLKIVIEEEIEADKGADNKPYAYVSIAYGEICNTSFSTIMQLEEYRCSFILGRMGGTSKKKTKASIQNCSCFVAFIDRHYVESDEINDLRTAIELGKKIAVYQTEECDLPKDLMSLQSIHQLRYNTGSEEERTVKLINWLTENKCRDSYEFNDFDYETNDDGIRLIKYAGRQVHLSIEPFFCGVPVVSIGGFHHCDFIKSVVIPEGVKEICFSAFAGCTNLREVSIPSTIIEIGSGAFNDCLHLNHIEIPNTVRHIGCGAFSDCDNLKSLSLPAHIPAASGIYSGWPNLKSVIIPGNEHEVGDCAFKDCRGLESVVIQEGVTQIGYDAFAGCIKLKSISIPEGVTRIDGHAFGDCREIKTIEFPASLKSIRLRVFDGCDNLEKVVFWGMDTKVFSLKQCPTPIFCRKDSWVQLHCAKMGIPYTLLEN